ncbi:MAG: bifunctional phosphopantothenoylcysteine decarboxylase/phosphopantothenate--cysteine ligase CoaBC, partial [Rhodobacteraceae bacterium]|nr:bifunctional phosphopantothenoylcysteine decarboxylase/phosphopantothenate--cysteine ligase CoaBC [Paracoccaceae bacterium]
MLAGNNILLIISGGIAAYKSLDLIRRMRERGASVTPVMTQAACEFVTPLSVSALAGVQVYHDLFDLTAESDMGHIQLSRSADLVVVAPATADLIAKMANGLANDLASTLLLATDTPVLIAPAMNVRMWDHPATQRNLAQLVADGVHIVGPNPGDMACGEYGPGRMSEPLEIIDAIAAHFAPRPLEGHKVLVTSGPTHEPIDPVRYIANRSSGAQGTAIAAALRDLGADVRFVTGPADVPPPNGVQVIQVESAYDMFDAVKANLDVSCAIFAAAVADWRVENASGSKIKKQNGSLPELSLTENPDILAHVAQLGTDARPPLVIGFAAETDDVIE